MVQEAMKRKRILVLELDDASLPGYCSFSKYYMGYPEDIEKFIEASERDHLNEQLTETYRRYEKGDTQATYYVADQMSQLVTEASVVTESERTIGETEWTFLNTWGFPYFMKAESVAVKVAVVKYQGKYYRVMKGCFVNLAYKDDVGIKSDWSILDGFFLGYPKMMVHKQQDARHLISCRLYVTEKQYATQKEALDDYESTLDLSKMCVDIFGDG